ncbi:MAG: hypothetical protein D3909_14755, partial [Candidatus Electrothrix sp. ATG1]|nr:hypothetical protein [Candidatus Electrothrix sp. ATG1]
LHKKIALRTAKEMTWILRADSLLLQESISYFRENTYLPQNSQHELTEYYRKSGGFLKNNMRLSALERYHTMIELFEKYGRKYNFPSVLLAALGYQESELDSSRLGENGRVGLMGINPSVVQQEGIKVDLQRIQKPEENIHATARYLRFLADRYFSSPKLSKLDQNLMALAAYRTSPEQVMGARKKAALAGYNPDIWFNHVETAMPAEQGKDVTQYVRNIYKYMKAYVSFLKQNKTAE